MFESLWRQSEKATAREAKEAERRALIAQRQHDALQMLRNIPFIECGISDVVEVSDGKSGAFSSSHTVYEILVVVPKDVYKAATHRVRQRYSRFAALHDALLKAWGQQIKLPRLPAKQFSLSGLTPAQRDERRAGLQANLQAANTRN